MARPEVPRVVVLAGGPLGATLLALVGERSRDGRCVVAGVVASHAPGTPRRGCPLVSAWASREGVPLLYAPSWRGEDADALVARVAGWQPDLLLSVAYDLILPPAVLRLAPRAVNVHRGLAEHLRGAYSTTWALELGHAEAGVTIHAMTPEVDAGDALARRAVPLREDWTAAEAIPAVEDAAVALFDDVLDDLLADRLAGTPQDSATAQTFGRVLPDHDLDATPGLRSRLRALHNPPYPGPGIALGSRRFELAEVLPPLPEPDPSAPVPFAAPAPAPGARGDAAVLAGGRPHLWCRSVVCAFDAVARTLGHAPLMARWACGVPPSDADRAAADLEDRAHATLARTPQLAPYAMLDLRGTLGIPAALIVLRDDDVTLPVLAPDETLDAATLLVARRAADVAAARLAADALVPAYVEALREHDPAARPALHTFWPLGTFAQGFPVHDPAPHATAAGLARRGVQALVVGDEVLALPCHGGMSPAVVRRVVADLVAVRDETRVTAP